LSVLTTGEPLLAQAAAGMAVAKLKLIANATRTEIMLSLTLEDNMVQVSF
jgi:hypothetical protein